MHDAVIVAAARSPIGRAFKGSMTELRPDDLTATIVDATMAQVPQLSPDHLDDLHLGCGLPGGEQGFNMGRVVTTLLGWERVPGTTITRYCSSSLQTTRMAFHAIKAGEGDVFVSAGVEMVSRYVNGNSDTLPDTRNPRFADAQARTQKVTDEGADAWEPAELPDIAPIPLADSDQDRESRRNDRFPEASFRMVRSGFHVFSPNGSGRSVWLAGIRSKWLVLIVVI
jgi:acetyl-CoA C-acetyltransferase